MPGRNKPRSLLGTGNLPGDIIPGGGLYSKIPAILALIVIAIGDKREEGLIACEPVGHDDIARQQARHGRGDERVGKTDQFLMCQAGSQRNQGHQLYLHRNPCFGASFIPAQTINLGHDFRAYLYRIVFTRGRFAVMPAHHGGD